MFKNNCQAIFFINLKLKLNFIDFLKIFKKRFSNVLKYL